VSPLSYELFELYGDYTAVTKPAADYDTVFALLIRLMVARILAYARTDLLLAWTARLYDSAAPTQSEHEIAENAYCIVVSTIILRRHCSYVHDEQTNVLSNTDLL
jgi:hypothetical protein